MDIVKLLDEARARTDVLTHPFYERWSAGTLAPEELRLYAGQYRHAVIALADASQAVADVAPEGIRDGLQRHAQEERSHVELWDRFAQTLGAEPAAPALPQTAQCQHAWTAGEDLVERLGILYALEASQPAISTTKLTGLSEHYGIGDDSSGQSYFKLHATLDVKHADQAAALLRELAREQDTDRILAAAEAALEGNWLLLDGVDAQRAAAGLS
jgi:pyrroloquinoline-quinone synthase